MTNTIAKRYTNFYVLGDSLSDAGALVGALNSVLTLAKEEFHVFKWVDKVYFEPPFYAERSFSNGPVAVEHVATRLQLPMQPGWSFHVTPALKQWMLEKQAAELVTDFVLEKLGIQYLSCTLHDQVGTNYAVSYAKATPGHALADFLFFNQFQLKNQVAALLKHHPAAGQNDLFFILIGANDVMYAVVHEESTIITESIQAIEEAITRLALQGASHIVIGDLPDIGKIPAFLHTSGQALATRLTQLFNEQLAHTVEALQKKYPQTTIQLFSLATTFEAMLADYQKKGYTTDQACIADIADHTNFMMLCELLLTGALQATYNKGCSLDKLCHYLFFDYFHPTQEPHQYLGDQLYDCIVQGKG